MVKNKKNNILYLSIILLILFLFFLIYILSIKKKENFENNIIIFENRLEMIKKLVKPNGIYAEIGVFKGVLSDKLYNMLNPSELYLIDLFSGIMDSGDQDGNNFEKYDLDISYSDLINKYKSTNITILKGYSYELLSSFDDNYFDMIYLDGDHTYEGVKKDLEVSYKKIKNNAFIMGHDYEMNYNKTKNTYNFGVKQAVDEFCLKYNQKVYAKGMDGCVSYAILCNK
jgi:hypothetical protein